MIWVCAANFISLTTDPELDCKVSAQRNAEVRVGCYNLVPKRVEMYLYEHL